MAGATPAASGGRAEHLVRNYDHIEPPHDPRYHLTEDITQQALAWIDQKQSYATDKPFFMYWAPGAAHGPHHIWPEWADKYKGKFDDGWDAYFDRVLTDKDLVDASDEVRKGIAEFAASFARLEDETRIANEDDREDQKACPEARGGPAVATSGRLPHRCTLPEILVPILTKTAAKTSSELRAVDATQIGGESPSHLKASFEPLVSIGTGHFRLRHVR